MKKELRIVFMGTPDFAVSTLKALLENNLNIVVVVTAQDKPSGRGRKVSSSAVKQFAIQHKLPVLQPDKLKSEEFISQLKSYQPNLFIVVAFRMLPESVFTIPKLGTINLHASLLPQYRGAAPINHVIMNGEKETGVTTFFIEKQIDTGSIIFQEATSIYQDDTAGSLHDRLMAFGAKLVLKTIKALQEGNIDSIKQERLIEKNQVLKKAPKIFKENCRVDWQKEVEKVYNFIRGLSPYPGAYTFIISPEGKFYQLKIFNSGIEKTDQTNIPGKIITDQSSFLHITTPDGILSLKEIQLAGKKRMTTEAFLKGFSINQDWKVK